MHSIKLRPFLFALLLASCTVPDKASLSVMMATKKFRKSSVNFVAYKSGTVTHDKLEFRENNSFVYQSRFPGKQKIIFYAGTFIKEGDTILLKFQNNYKDSMWTGKAVIDTLGKLITLISRNSSFNKQMIITKIK